MNNNCNKNKSRTANSRFAKAGVSCFYDSEVLNSSFVHLMKFSAENPRPSPIRGTLAVSLKNKTMTDKSLIKQIRKPTKDNPLRILMSSCLTGLKCGYDGSSYGEYPSALKLMQYDTVKIVRFCPEEFSFGTPREMCDIHDGNGLDVLNGNAKV